MNLIRPRSRNIIVPHDDTGEATGYLTEHWDDHVDATVVVPNTIEIARPGAQMMTGVNEKEIVERVNREYFHE